MNEKHFLGHPRVGGKIILQRIFNNSRGEAVGVWMDWYIHITSSNGLL